MTGMVSCKVPALRLTQRIITSDIWSALLARYSSHFNKKFSKNGTQNGTESTGDHSLGQEAKCLGGV